MPPVGFICPIERKEVPWDHFETCDVRKGRPAYPAPLARAEAEKIKNDVRHSSLALTTTRTMGCTRDVYISAMYDYYLNVNKIATRSRGTLLHEAYAKYTDPKYWFTEDDERMKLTVAGTIGGYKMSGLVDALRRDFKEMVDYKFPMDFAVRWRAKFGAGDMGSCQLNINRILLGQQAWAQEAGYDPDGCALTLWNNACGKAEGPVAFPVEHMTEEDILETKCAGNTFTIEQVIQVHEWMEVEHAKDPENPEHQERVASSLPLAGQTMFNATKCSMYCDVERICSRLVRKNGEPTAITWEDEDGGDE